uniref:adhesion G-protein coupled receptor G7-like isoform X1 n=1 Tax=Styela clava TaxID=7725 RepID=UPI001939CF6C|nr:adhesion G-protein coupled receptor G7-like isoform X1 [Styela clava]
MIERILIISIFIGIARANLEVSDIRLTGGKTENQGFVEILSRGSWGRICVDDWGIEESAVVCRMLNFNRFANLSVDATDPGTPFVYTNGLQCVGTEIRLTDCATDLSKTSSCSIAIVKVFCSEIEDVRLSGGYKPNQGYVEVKSEGKWGQLCSANWGDNETEAVCRQVGFQRIGKSLKAKILTKSILPIFLNNITCAGDETELRFCNHGLLGESNCTNKENVTIVCSEIENVRLSGGDKINQGYVEVQSAGEWGKICSKKWSAKETKAVCRHLGYERIAFIHAITVDQPASPGFLDNLECAGNETNLRDCQHQSIGFSNCSENKENVTIVCSEIEAVRLRGGRSRNQGFVEILSEGEWGLVCDNDWGMLNKEVVCRQLGYYRVSLLPVAATQPNSSVFLDNISCTGKENHLRNCTHGKLTTSSDCTNKQWAKIVCTDSISVGPGIAHLKYLSYETNETYNFVCRDANNSRYVRSNETCDNSELASSIECKSTIISDGVDIDFDYSTYVEFNCNSTFNSLLEEVASAEIKTNKAKAILGDLSAISANMSTSNQENETDIQMVVDIVSNLQKGVSQGDATVEKSGMTFLVWSTDQFHTAVTAELDGKSNKPNDSTITVFTTAVEDFSNNLNVDSEEGKMIVETYSSVFEATEVNGTNIQNVTFQHTNVTKSQLVTAEIPASAFTNATDNNTISNKVASFYLHRDSALYPNPKVENTKISKVLSVKVAGITLTNLTESIKLGFGYEEDIIEKFPDFKKAKVIHFEKCAYLNTSTNEWETYGCRIELNEDRVTRCFCDHATSFAVLVQTYKVPVAFELQIVGYIGCVSSIVGLFFMLLIYGLFRDLRSGQINQIHMHMGFCLLAMYITFLVGIERNKNYIACMSVAAFLQFTLLSVWGWMLAENITMCKKFFTMNSKCGPKYTLKFAVVIYVVCAAAASINAGVISMKDKNRWDQWKLVQENGTRFRPSEYIGDTLCWLHGYSLFFGFLTPIGIVLVINMIGCVAIARKIAMSGSKVRSKKTEVSEHIFRTVMVGVLLGVTWVFAIPLTLTHDEIVNGIFGWLFNIFNAFQGLVIFLLLCVKRKDVRDMWVGKLREMLGKRETKKQPTSAVSNTATTSLTGRITGTSVIQQKVVSHAVEYYENLEQNNNDEPVGQ